MNAEAIKSATGARDPIGDSTANNRTVRASRVLGGGSAAVVALGATLIAAGLNGGWFLALGIPSATMIGWFFGPSVRSDRWPLPPTIAMATLTIGLADALAVVPAMVRSGGGYATRDVDPISATAFVLLASLVAWFLGLIVVGLLSLGVTIPCAVIWALLVRSLIRRGIGIGADERLKP